MLVTITRPAGTARCEVFSQVLGQGFDIPAGPCTLAVPNEIVGAIPGAVVVADVTDEPADPAEE